MFYRRGIYSAAFLLAALFFLSVPVGAQTRIGTVQGTVKDPNGALVSGATVTINQAVSGYHQTARTDAQGAFKIVNVPFNTYTLRAEA